jgi:hypothetical protein
MKAKILFCLMLLILGNCSLVVVGQDYQKYYQLIAEAEQLYENSEFLLSAQKYSDAFIALGNKGTMGDRYNAACSWALAGKKDSSFIQLFKIANGNFMEYDYMVADEDFTSLYQDPRWTEVVEIVKTNKEKAEANLDKKLVAILDTIYMTDQKYRLQIDSVGNEYGWESTELESFTKVIDIKIKEIDSVNLIKVEEIIDKYGWLGSDIIGDQGNITLWLVIQHSDLAVQEKYLPIMREAAKNGKAPSSHLAYLEDRVAIRRGKKQIYGSQIGGDLEKHISYVLPLEDPDNVDLRRAEAGLSPLAEYLLQYGIKWDVEQYKKDLPRIEEMEKAKQK